jgi:hypothetical protein
VKPALRPITASSSAFVLPDCCACTNRSVPSIAVSMPEPTARTRPACGTRALFSSSRAGRMMSFHTLPPAYVNAIDFA